MSRLPHANHRAVGLLLIDIPSLDPYLLCLNDGLSDDSLLNDRLLNHDRLLNNHRLRHDRRLCDHDRRGLRRSGDCRSEDCSTNDTGGNSDTIATVMVMMRSRWRRRMMRRKRTRSGTRTMRRGEGTSRHCGGTNND